MSVETLRTNNWRVRLFNTFFRLQDKPMPSETDSCSMRKAIWFDLPVVWFQKTVLFSWLRIWMVLGLVDIALIHTTGIFPIGNVLTICFFFLLFTSLIEVLWVMFRDHKKTVAEREKLPDPFLVQVVNVPVMALSRSDLGTKLGKRINKLFETYPKGSLRVILVAIALLIVYAISVLLTVLWETLGLIAIVVVSFIALWFLFKVSQVLVMGLLSLLDMPKDGFTQAFNAWYIRAKSVLCHKIVIVD